MKKQILIGSLFALITLMSLGQEKIIDQVVAVVGNNMILQSDIETQYLQMRSQGYSGSSDLKCEVLEDILSAKLMLNQARLDSLEVSPAQVEQEIDARLNGFVEQIGSIERLEAYYNKSLLEIKEDFRDVIRNQLLTQQMQRQITSEITVTPSEIKSFFKTIPKDSLPIIPAQVVYKQIIRNPPYSEQTKLVVREQLLDLRRRITEGEDFATLAILYSEDPGSAAKGGELGYMSRSDLVKEFADVAFSLKKGAVSSIVETSFGFHIIQMIDRKGEAVNVRHILIKPNISPEERNEAMTFLDSLAGQIRLDSVSFQLAAQLFSQDEDSRLSGGQVINQNTGDTKFQLDQLDQATAEAVQNLEPGDISKAFETTSLTGNTVYSIIILEKRIPAHKADLKNDYSILQEMTRMSMQQQAFREWIVEKQQTTYIRVDDSFKGCPFRLEGWIK